MAAALRQNRAHGHWGGSGYAGGRRWLVWLRAAAAAAGVAPGGGSDGSCRRWRREQGRWKQVRQWLRALAMARTVGAAALLVAGSVCSGSVRARHWGSRAQMAVGESGSAGHQ